jgi:RsmE family RNA methyltransferase
LIEDELDVLCPDSQRVMAHPDAAGRTVWDVVAHTAHDDPSNRRVLLAVGPEGGWTAFERELLTTHGFVPVSMGKRTLATTTACIALLTLVHAALDLP